MVHYLNSLIANTNNQIVRQNGTEFGVGTIPSQLGQPLMETFTVKFRNNDVYVAFHAASRKERETVLQLLQHALAAENVKCEFDEL